MSEDRGIRLRISECRLRIEGAEGRKRYWLFVICYWEPKPPAFGIRCSVFGKR
ncbi:hypothetical protein D1AOALGA4SA_6935 [Olavius algarvensis Delta 1 endosymbiont]|nr:hypothetical protein D1AOALGA4SA_6935 [Olavius algarvensis Delta 1 endosymbiont]